MVENIIKKNHYNAFCREYEGRYEFKLLDSTHHDEIMDYLENWKQHKEHTEEKEFIDFEAIGIKYLLEHENVFDYKIGSVYIDDKLEAFTIEITTNRKIWFIFLWKKLIQTFVVYILLYVASS